MDQAIDLHTGGLYVTQHVTPKLPGPTSTNASEAITSIHFSGYCLDSKVPNFFELWSRLFRAPCWSDVQRLVTLILMDASGEWSANVIADSGERHSCSESGCLLPLYVHLSVDLSLFLLACGIYAIFPVMHNLIPESRSPM